MLTRLTHSAIAFAITVVVYQAYVLLAAPIIEPPAVVQASGEGDLLAKPQATHKYRELLAAYFPPGHWTLTHPPITAENGQAMIVLDEFKPRDDGQVRVRKCAMLFFPQGRVRGELPPNDAVVLEAPHGAVLQMDKSLQRGLGGFGKIRWGKLTGQITIRSNMREPGPQDDLMLTARDVEIQEGLIYSMGRVDMQLGPHRGSGRHLEIRLKAGERGRTDAPGLSFGSIDSLEIRQEVQAQLSPGHVQLGPNTLDTGGARNAPPVEITCNGKFRFDFPSQVASFDDQVLLRQVHPQGQLDELRCKRLAVYFTYADNPDAGVSQTGLSVGLIEATGDKHSPVLLDSQSQQASARCERMRIDLGPRRVTFDRGPEVMLTFQGKEIHAKQVRYTAPPKNSTQRVGDFRASGSGWLRIRGKNKQSVEPFEVRWLENMWLRRINGQPVLSLNGRPQLDMVGMGKLWADHLDLYLRESAADGSEADLLPGDIVPERLTAGGNINIDSAQLQGNVKELEVRFDYVSSDLALAGPNLGNNPRTGRSPLGQPGLSGGAGKRAYDIVGETLKMLVTVRNRKPEVTSIDVDGQVVFDESAGNEFSGHRASKEPLKVVADHLQIKNADSPAAELLLTGKPATITADGMVIRTEKLQVNRGTSRAWVDAPGEIEMLVDRDLSGKLLATPQPMTIRWHRSMELNKDRITFSGNVQVRTAEGKLDTQQMVVRLTAPVQFDGAANQRRIEVAQLECHGGANAIFTQRDALGLASVQTIKLEESFFANLQNGKIRGEGPGRMESVHLSSSTHSLGQFASGNGRQRERGRLASAGRQPQPAQRLRFLGIEFNRGIQGNRQSRQMKLIGDVDAVYGPVDAWEQRLALTKRGMPGPETIWINCQSLGVAESPLARLNPSRRRSQQSSLGPLELLAEGNVTIEGPVGEGGNFTTRSRLAKYDQSKTTFTLQGNQQQPATITYQEYRNAPPQSTSALTIKYTQSNGKLETMGFVGGQLRQLAPVGGR